ncbi:MAG: D-alanine--D-alanine ligase [Ruminococcus sp.]|nr:D-alanine--D-alanine ligase [Ruminococcus sp.]MDE7097671.1 D-alanine--D-alanine ligase [Ruminococcus sp.]
MAKIKTAVIFGGTSQEHELSLASASEVIRNIPGDKYDVTPIGITKKGRWLCFQGDVDEIADGSWELNPDCISAILSPDPLHRGFITLENGEATIRRFDVIFPVLHGKKGADGTIQGLLDMSGIPYVGSGLLASASCMDKSHTHMILDDYGIKTAEWRLLTQRDLNRIDEKCVEIAESLDFPLAVKPANSGCSAGTSTAHNLNELITAVKIAFSNDNKVVVEKFVDGRKLEVAVFGYDTPFASYVGEILSTDREYNPIEVRKSSGDDLKIPADLPNEMHNTIRETAVKAFKALGCKGIARVDFFLQNDGTLFLNKIGTAPGLRLNSVYPKLMNHFGMNMPYFIDKLLEQAIDNFDEKTY